MTRYTQASRPMRVDSALEADALLLERFRGIEAVSRPFSYEVDLLSREDAIDPAEILRTPMLLTVQGVADEPRLIHGMVSRFLQLGQIERLTAYRAHVVPWLWFLTLRKDCRIYQDMSVLEIVEEVFQSQGYSDFDVRCARDYPKREYCVQYRESNLDFVSRLLEHEGIFYFFEHTEDGHLLVLADDNSLIPSCPGQESARMAPEPVPDEDVVTLLRREHAVSAGTMTLADYDPLQPSLDLLSSISGTEVEEVYDYPGDYMDLERGEWYSRIRLEEEEARRHLVHGEGTCRLFRSGYKVGLKGHYRRDTNQDYVLLEVSHSAKAGDYRSWDSATLDYTNTFTALPLSVPYRPPRRTRKPVVKGAQTAVVVGKSGEEVWVDRHGRVKVQFHWDREGQRDENSSCWVRVATPWGGKGYGGVSIPRIGNEVIVDFLEGDPDRPIIAGSVYNAEQSPPFALPDAGIQMGMKSRSSPGGGGHNEITMTDTKGEEMVNIHAQYDMTTTVGHDDTQTVTNDRTVTVKGKLTETITKDTSVTITEGNLTVTVSDGKADVTAKKAVTETFHDTQTTKVKKKVAITSLEADVHVTASTEVKLVSGDSSLVLQKDGTIKLIGKKVLIQGKDQVDVGGKKISVSAGDEAKVGVGNQNVTCDKTKVGVSGAAINSSAVGMHEITGALVKIN